MESSRRWAEIEAFLPIAKASSHPYPIYPNHSLTHSFTDSANGVLAVCFPGFIAARSMCQMHAGEREFLP